MMTRNDLVQQLFGCLTDMVGVIKIDDTKEGEMVITTDDGQVYAIVILQGPDREVFGRIAASLFEQHERVDREHQQAPIANGPRAGNVRYDDRYWHGYRDALENVRMEIQDEAEAAWEARTEASNR